MSDLLTICLYALVEGVAYRPLSAWWRLRGTVDYWTNTQGWGAMTRKGFAPAAKG